MKYNYKISALNKNEIQILLNDLNYIFYKDYLESFKVIIFKDNIELNKIFIRDNQCNNPNITKDELDFCNHIINQYFKYNESIDLIKYNKQKTQIEDNYNSLKLLLESDYIAKMSKYKVSDILKLKNDTTIEIKEISIDSRSFCKYERENGSGINYLVLDLNRKNAINLLQEQIDFLLL